MYVLVNLLLMKCIHIFVCVHFLYCDTLKKLHHNHRHFYIIFKNTAILDISIKNIYHIQTYKSFG